MKAILAAIILPLSAFILFTDGADLPLCILAVGIAVAFIVGVRRSSEKPKNDGSPVVRVRRVNGYRH